MAELLQFNGTNQYGSNSLNYSTTSFTIVAASRYSGAIRGRVISSTSNNWLLGHHGASCEEYYAEGWISDTAVNDTKWRIYAATENYATDQRSFYVNNVLKVSNSTLGAQGFNGLNLGRYGPGNNEYSTCEVGFILVYNRMLICVASHIKMGFDWILVFGPLVLEAYHIHHLLTLKRVMRVK